MKTRRITIRTLRGLQEVTAACIGHMAAHRLVTAAGLDDGFYSVTHVPSGIKFGPNFETRRAAIAAATDINGMRNDWTTFDPQKAKRSKRFLSSLARIYERHGGIQFGGCGKTAAMKAARKCYATDLNGYKKVST